MSKDKPKRTRGSQAPWHADALIMFKEGRSQTDIANKHGVSRERVRQVLVSYGGHKSRPDPSKIKDKILSQFDSGKCVDEIAKSLNKRFSYIIKVLMRSGVNVDPFRRRVKQSIIFAKASSGMTMSQISKDTGISIGVVFYVLRRCMDQKAFQSLLKKGEDLRGKNISLASKRENINAQ